MIKTTAEYKKSIKENRIFRHKAEIAFPDGESILAEDKDLFSFQISDCTSSTSSFDLGTAMSQQLTLKLNNIDGLFDSHDFNGAAITAKVGLELADGSVEWLDKGTYVAEPGEDSGSTISVKAFDKMTNFDRSYTASNLDYPTTLGEIVRDACTCCDVVLASDSATFDNDNFVVQTRPDDSALTFRQVLCWVGQIASGFFRINTDGKLSMRKYNVSLLEATWKKDDVVIIEGNETIINVEEKEIIQAEKLGTGSTIQTDDVVITGIRVVEETENEDGSVDETVYQSGTNGYVLEISENKFIQNGSGNTVASYIGERLNGMQFRPMSVKVQLDPAYEAGDLGLVKDRKGTYYKTIFTDIVYTAHAFQTLTCGAEAPTRASSVRYSQATQVFKELRSKLYKQQTEWNKAFGNLQEEMSTKSGLFPISQKQDDGSTILYFCNRSTLEDSSIVVKFSAAGWAMSTDGGNTWNSGWLVDGTMITSILNAIGVNANWINTGAITVKDSSGNIIFQVDMDTKKVVISGDSVQIGGKTATKALSDTLQESKDYADGQLADYANTVTKSIAGLQNQIDGQVETFFYDYEPSLQNIPASEWTSSEEREKHEGDLFFWKSTGYAYRFTKDGSAWKWQVVQDTDITKALAAAENAQNTANNKRRVFVVQPTPPYDIGDQWMQDGGDILVCQTSRAAGSSYVSSDWKKMNKYTDDTVANEALNAAALARNMTLELTNDYQSIVTDADGNISGTFPVVATRAIVMYGSQDITAECSYTISKSDAISGKWDDSTKSYTVTGITADEGWVDIKATYISSLSVVKRFTIAKLKAGKDGINGKDGVNGKDGTNGKDGISITVKSSSVTYQASSSGTEVPTGNWLGSVPSVSNGQYLWTKTTVTYSDGTSVTSYGVSYKGTNGTNGKDGTDGEKGDPGADGRGISSASVTYQASSSGTTAPTGTWSSSIPEVSEGQYLWTKTVISYTSGSPTTSYSVSKIGKDGTNGISPTVSLTKSDGTTTITIKDATGTHTQTVKDGTNGTPGEPGTDGKTPYFHVKYSNDGGKTFTSNNGETAGDYIGTCTDYNEADPTAVGAYSWALIKGDKGDTGVAGAKGDTGATGAKGDKGDTGEAGRTYFIEPSCNVLKRSSDNNFSPGFIEFKAYYRDGTSATRTAYNGRFVIEETSDGNTWTTIYTSSANENTVKHYLYSIPVDGDSQAIADSATMIGIPRDVTNIRCKLYAAGGTTTLIDMESVAVVVDVDALTHEEIFNLLTNNGAVKGIYKEGNQLYISFTYAKGGTLTLGGKENGNGLLKILDASGNQVGYIDNTGVNFTKGTFSGTLSAASGTFKGDVSGATGTFKGDISGATGTFTGGINAASGNIGGWIIDKTNGTLKSANGKIVLNSKDDKILINDVPMYAYGSGLIIDGGFTIRVGNDDFSDGTDRFQLCNISTLTSGNYLRLYSNAVYQSSSSSKRYKEIGQDISEKDIESWYNIQPVWAKYKDGYLTKNDPRNGIEFPMFIAEDVEEYFPLAVDHLEDGKAENWNERIMIPAMFAMLKQQKTEIDALKQELQELKNLLREE